MLDHWTGIGSNPERVHGTLKGMSAMSSAGTKTVYKVGDFLSWQRSGSLALSPNFQRRSVWPAAAKSYFMDTIVRGHPIPLVFLRERTDLESSEPRREVVDGRQRLRTIITYIEPESLKDYNRERDHFEIKKTHNPETAGKSFGQLPADLRRRILAYEFSVHVLPSNTEDREVLHIFARMNSTGVKANAQELRNAKFYGEFKKIAYDLAYEQLTRWRNWKLFTESDIARMIEVEETSELLRLMLSGIHGKDQEAIDKLYETYDEEFPESGEVATRFRTILDMIDTTFGKDIHTTVYSRRSMFYTLFSFYYEHTYSFLNDFQRRGPKKLPPEAVAAARVASNLIQIGDFNEELAKVLRGATSDSGSRKRRLEFLDKAMENVQAQLHPG